MSVYVDDRKVLRIEMLGESYTLVQFLKFMGQSVVLTGVLWGWAWIMIAGLKVVVE